MIHSTINYLKHHVTVDEKFEQVFPGMRIEMTNPISLIEHIAQFILGSQRSFFSQFDPLKYFHNITIIITPNGSSEFKMNILKQFSELNFPHKIIRITLIALSAITAVATALILIPCALVLHHIAMARNPKLRLAFEKMNEYDYRTELILIESRNYEVCSNLIETHNIKKNERFFQKTPKGLSPFELVCRKYKNTPNDAVLKNLLFKMILNCPKRDHLMESFSDGSHWLTALPINEVTENMFQIVINSCTSEQAKNFLEIRGFNGGGNLVSTLAHAGWIDLLDRFLEKLDWPLPDNFYVSDAQDQTVLDLLIKANRYDYIKNRLFSENQAANWNLLFGPMTQLKNWPEHLRNAFLEKILTMDPDTQIAILMHQDSDGNTLLHKSLELFDFFPLNYLGIPVLLNRQGLSQAMCRFQITQEWFAAPKPAVVSAEIKETEYDARATNLRTNVMQMWESCVQDLNAGRLNRQLLWSEGAFLNIERITQELRNLFDGIVTQRPGFGAPVHGTPECYGFLSDMIINFETIYGGLLRKNDPAESAGVFIDIAKVVLVGVCRRGVYEVVEQKAQLYPAEGEEMTFELLFDKKIVQWLKMQIQVVYSKHYENNPRYRENQNVHNLTKLREICKLTKGTDIYASLNVAEMWENIHKECTFLSLIKYLHENIGPDMAQEYLKSLAPAVQGRYKDFILQAQETEIDARCELEHKLIQHGFHPNTDLKLAIQNVKQANFPIIEAGQNLIIAILKRKEAELKRITGCQDLDLVGIYAQVNGDYSKVEEAVIDLLTTKGLWNNQMRMRVRPKSIESSLRADIEAAKNFQHVCDEMGFGNDHNKMNELIALQKAFRARHETFVEELETQQPETDEVDISWDKFRYPLPSQAWVANYRTQWAAPFMGSTGATICRILELKGVIAIDA